MKYIDIHTHKTVLENDVISVKNLFLQDTLSVPDSGYYSIGLHPWHLDNLKDTIESELDKLEKILSESKNVIVGECGLDKSIAVPPELQKFAFTEQLKLAEKYSKPVVIHSVKSFNEIISIYKKQKLSIPLIFHAYTANMQINEQLLKLNSFFSFGIRLLKDEKTQNVFKEIPVDRLFFETDNDDIHIEQLYTFGSAILKLNCAVLQSYLTNNFYSVINIS